MPAATQPGVFGIGELPSGGAGPQIGLEVTRRHAHKDTECVVGLSEQDLQPGDCGSGLFQDGPCLFDVELGRRADAEPLLGEGENALLNPDVVSRDLDPLLGDPVLHIVRSDVREKCDERRVVILHRCIETGVG